MRDLDPGLIRGSGPRSLEAHGVALFSSCTAL